MMNSAPPKNSLIFSESGGRWLMRLTGWRFEGEIPLTLKSFVLVGAPHTSNWDVFYGAIGLYSVGVFTHWKPLVITKMQAMRGWMGVAMRRLGGVGVDRSAPQNLVSQAIEQLQGPARRVLVIAPEGARHKVDYWKTGFYRIALGAQVPIVMGTLDYIQKRFIVSPPLTLTGDPAVDLVAMRAFFQGRVGKFPHEVGEIRFKPEGKEVDR